MSYLLHGTLGLEQYPTTQELSENASHGPDVDSGRVVAGTHKDLGCPVVLRDHLLCHVLGLVGLFDACQPEITDLEHAVAVDEQVAGLDVPVQDACRVEILEPAQDLVEEHFDVVLGQVLRRHDDLVQVRLQQLCYHISRGGGREVQLDRGRPRGRRM